MHMVIIGAGECGTRAAFALREAGHDGPITLLGLEPGLPYERPPLSKPMDGQVQRRAICDQPALEAARIDYRPDTAVLSIDRAARQVHLAPDPLPYDPLPYDHLPYDRLLIATGAQPRRLTCEGAHHARDFRSHADASAVFDAALGPVAIIGAGLIGMELASTLRTRRVPVTVIELGPSPLARAVPPRFAQQLHAHHLAQGTEFHFGQAITRIDPHGVTLANGQTVPAVLTVSAIGVTPDLALAKDAGLATGNGILTDAHLTTSDPAIFAAGDCAALPLPGGGHTRHETWRNARQQAETAARNMLGASEPFAAIPWFWSDQFDLGLQVAGQPQPHHDQILRAQGDAELAFYLDQGRLVACAGLGPGTSIARDVKLAEMLIALGLHPDPTALADPSVNLKALLKTAKAA